MFFLFEFEFRVRFRIRRVVGREEEEKGRRDFSEREGRVYRSLCMFVFLDYLERMKIVLFLCFM